MRQAVTRSGIIHCLGVQWRYRPQTAILRRILAENPPTLICGTWYWHTPPVAWLRSRAAGGGQVFDQQVHLLDLCNFVVGDVAKVFARFSESPNPRYPDFANWDVYSLSLDYGGRCVGSFNSTYRLNIPFQDRVGIDFISGDLLVRYRPDGLHVLGPEKVEMYPETGEQTLHMVGRDHIERAFLAAVASCDPSGLVSTVDDIWNTMEVLFAATESATSGREVVITASEGRSQR